MNASVSIAIGIGLIAAGVAYAIRGAMQHCKHRVLNGVMVGLAGAVQLLPVDMWLKISSLAAVAVIILGVDAVKSRKR